MTPETTRLLTQWNQDRLAVQKLRERLHAIAADIALVEKRMGSIPIALEGSLFSMEQPLGLKIGDDYIVVIQDTQSDEFSIQVVDFNLREEIANDS